MIVDLQEKQNGDDSTKEMDNYQWIFPSLGWRKENFDGVAKGNRMLARCGGVIRDNLGHG